jgi:hypothetical protein
MTSTKQPNPIAAINDRFRSKGPGGDLQGMMVATAGIAALPALIKTAIVATVQSFEAFDEDNDPYGEHDFGAIEITGAGKVFWKIDYYADADLEWGSEDPADLARTYRVLTIMLASEY